MQPSLVGPDLQMQGQVLVGPGQSAQTGHRVPPLIPENALPGLQAVGIGEGGRNTTMHLHIAGAVVGVQIRRDGMISPAEAEEFDALNHPAIIGTYYPFVVASIVNSLKITGGLRALEEAKPFSPVPEPAPIHTVVYRPAYAFPGVGQPWVASGVYCRLIAWHYQAHVLAGRVSRSRGEHSVQPEFVFNGMIGRILNAGCYVKKRLIVKQSDGNHGPYAVIGICVPHADANAIR